jgi:hypothetical protein
MVESPAKAKAKAKPAAPEAPWKPVKPVLLLRTCSADGSSHGGFRWPTEVGAVVTPVKWVGDAECGNGLHGWLWGIGDWSNKIGGHDRLWYVLEAEESEVITLHGKVKVPRCRVAWVGKRWNEAMAHIHASACYLRRALNAESAATGDYGHAAATGDYGHAAATGDSGHAAATGDSGHAAATGKSGHAAATGYSGHAAATGDSGHAAATGDSGHAAATGYYGHAAATGYCGHAAATGYSGHAAATGDSGHAAATGYYGHAAATGDYGHAAATGKSGHAAATGDSGHAAATGDSGHAAATGDSGHAAATGYYGHAAATGDYGCGVALGHNSKVQAGLNGLIAATWGDGARRRLLVGYVGEGGIKVGRDYRIVLTDGVPAWQEVAP